MGNLVKTALVVFAREPREGKVKTRLCDGISEKIVNILYTAFLRDILEIAHKTPSDARFIFYDDPEKTSPFLNKYADRFYLKRQIGSTLGKRMFRAFEFCHNNGFERTIIIGTDCLTLQAKDITDAFHKMSDFDGVIGPTPDGGYYLIGLHTPIKELFTGIAWGESQVFKETMIKAKDLNVKFHILHEKEDVDTIDDLKTFQKKMPFCPGIDHTKNIVRHLKL